VYFIRAATVLTDIARSTFPFLSPGQYALKGAGVFIFGASWSGAFCVRKRESLLCDLFPFAVGWCGRALANLCFQEWSGSTGSKTLIARQRGAKRNRRRKQVNRVAKFISTSCLIQTRLPLFARIFSLLLILFVTQLTQRGDFH
jgi:hypothetical protein